jgi:hypothetical protein
VKIYWSKHNKTYDRAGEILDAVVGFQHFPSFWHVSGSFVWLP